MENAKVGGEPRHSGRSSALKAGKRSAGRPVHGEDALEQSYFTQSISLVEAVEQVENELAATLRVMAGQGEGAAVERRLKLAEDAAQGAQAAARVSDSLRQQASRRAEHAEATPPRWKLDHAAMVLANLAGAENTTASILTGLARRGDPDLAARCQHLAAEASAGAQRARVLAQSLRQLAASDAVRAVPDTTPAASTVDDGPPLEYVLDQRLADIGRRLAELRQAVPKPPPGEDQAPGLARDTPWRLQQADRHHEEAIAHLLQTQHLAAEAFCRAASAHDRTAKANARSAAAGVGDVAEHRRMAAFHRAAAKADRQKAQKLRDHAVDTESRIAKQARPAAKQLGTRAKTPRQPRTRGRQAG